MDKIPSRVYESARQQERERIRKFIEDIKNDFTGAPHLLNLFAPTGFGKTAFLEQIWVDYERVLPVSLVRAKSFLREDAEMLALDKMLIHIVDQLSERLPRRVASLPSDYTVWTNEQQLVELLLSLASGARDSERVTLLLIDDYDFIPEEQRHWLQERFFSPALRQGKTAIVLTSETELGFNESFELRMRLECRALTSLDPEAISRALPEYEGIADKIHRITGGLPVLTEQFVEQLKAFHVENPTDFQAYAQELIGKYYRAYVEDKVLKDFAPEVRETMLVLSLLRRFDIKVLREILPNLLPKPYQNYSTVDYLGLIDRLRPWVEWRRQGGYALNPAFRLMLEGYVLTIRPDLYKKVNRAAEIMYRRWLKEGNKEYREHYPLELLYHVLTLYRAENGSGLFPMLDEMSQARIGDELLKYLTEGSGQSLKGEDLDELLQSLEMDQDLRNYVTEEIKQAIRGLIAQRSKEAA